MLKVWSINSLETLKKNEKNEKKCLLLTRMIYFILFLVPLSKEILFFFFVLCENVPNISFLFLNLSYLEIVFRNKTESFRLKLYFKKTIGFYELYLNITKQN